MALPAPVQAAVVQAHQASRGYHVQVFNAIDPTTWAGKFKLAYLNRIAAKQARQTASPATLARKPILRPTLLDEVGNLGRLVRPAEIASWKGKLSTHHLNSDQAALLHIWLGEYALGHNQDPRQAIHQFDVARNLVRHSGPMEGLAAYDKGIALYRSGDYADSADTFAYLSKPTTDKRGYPWVNADLWLKHAEACVGYHNIRSTAGIPEPPRLDVFCLAASLAACLRGLGLPFDKKTVVAACRVTGEGSSLHDAVVGGPKLGVNVRPIGATEKGLIALPKPLIAYVEHDHFIAVTNADKKGVSYLCSDCGPWPGGKVTLTWKQWHMLDANIYATVTKPGSIWDKAISLVLSHGNAAKVQVASSGSLGIAIQLARAIQAIKGNVVNPTGLGALCTTFFTNLMCLFMPCPTDPACPCQHAGPTSGDPVNLAQLEEMYTPAPDITVYNPNGPSVVWQRNFGSLRLSGQFGDESADFGTGWSNSYNYLVDDPSTSDWVSVAQGSTGSILGQAGTTHLSTTWEILNPSGSVIATSTSAGGWNATLTSFNINVTVPSTATLGIGYEVMINRSSGPPSEFVDFNVCPSGTSGVMTTTGAKNVIMPNGAKIPFSASTFPTSSTPTVNCTVTQAGIAAAVQWDYDGVNASGHYVITFPDRTQFVTGGIEYQATSGAGSLNTTGDSNIVKEIDRNGNAISFSFSPAFGTAETRYLASISDVTSSTTLLTINRSGTGGPITSVADCYGRSVYYQPAASPYTGLLGQVSQIVTTGTSSPPARYTYGYETITGDHGNLTPVHTITVPSPTGSGTSTATLNYDSSGLMTSRVDGNGNTHIYVSPSGMNQTGVIVKNSSGNVIYTYSTTYDNNECETSQTDGNGTIVSYSVYTDPNDPYRPSKTYDGNAYLAAGLTDYSSQIPQSGSSSFKGTASDNPASGTWDIVNPSGTVIANSGSTGGWSVSVSTGTGVADTITVGAPSGATIGGYYEVRTTNGATGSGYFSVIASGASSIIGNSSAQPTQYTWDKYGNLKTITSPRGTTTTNTISYTNFALGELTSVQEGTKSATTFAYFEPSGLLETITSPLPGTTGSASTVQYSYTYDSLGNVLTITTPAANNTTGATITYTLNYTSDPGNSTYGIGSYSQSAAIGQPLTITDNLGKVTHFRYDSQRNLTEFIDAIGNETDQSYNIANQALQDTFPKTGQQGTGNGYQVNTYLYPGGPITATTNYDESNTQVAKVTHTYGAEGEMLTTAGSTAPVTLTYDALYRSATLTDGNSHTTSYLYNFAGYLYQTDLPGASSTTPGSSDTITYTSYDADGNPLVRKNGNNVESDYTYADTESQLTKIHYPAGGLSDVTASYDGYGRLSAEGDGTGSHSYTYDDLDNLLSDTTSFTGGASGQGISYTFYPNGSEEAMTTPAGTSNYSYDNDGRPSSLTNPFSETSSWTYADNGWLKTQTLGNGAVTTYTLNALGEVSDLVNKTSGGTTLSDFGSMAHNGLGDLTTLTASMPGHTAYAGTTTFSYDSISGIGTREQLTQEASGRNGSYTNNFAYDGGSYTASTGAGNPTSMRGTSHSFNSDNELTNTGFSYDGNGNPTTYSSTGLSFDPENRLTSVSGALTAATYNGFGQRVTKEPSSSTTYYLYDGGEPVLEENSSGTVTATNTFGANGLLSRNTSSGSTFYTFDQQGNTAQRLDSSQNVLTSHIYDSFGNGASSGSFTDPFGFGAQYGYYTDQETGLILCTNRYYDPGQGRWLTRDPIGFAGGINLYGYVGNDPMDGIDPLGLQEEAGKPIGNEPAGNGAILDPDSMEGSAQDNAAAIEAMAAGIDAFGNWAANTESLDWLDALMGDSRASRPPANIPPVITPYGPAEQGNDPESIGLAARALRGGPLYRKGITGTNFTGEGQFWAGENPADDPNYDANFGIPTRDPETGGFPFIVCGQLNPAEPWVSRPAPGFGNNPGGEPEIVTNPGGTVTLTWFHMP
jgi:RHS repeat-associated protein